MLNQAVEHINAFIQRAVTPFHDFIETLDVKFGCIDALVHLLSQRGRDLALLFIDTQVASQADLQGFELSEGERWQLAHGFVNDRCAVISQHFEIAETVVDELQALDDCQVQGGQILRASRLAFIVNVYLGIED